MKFPSRNVEIKAKVKNKVEVLAIAGELSRSSGEIIKQNDYFFNVSNGRLKLRIMDHQAELIYYERPDLEGPKLCEYDKCAVEDSEALKLVLERALGIHGHVEKMRQLFVVGQTRIHVDQVQGLGDYMELEVVLKDNQAVEDGEAIAKSLMTAFGVSSADLITTAYVDLLK